jgi:hypothetical protein
MRRFVQAFSLHRETRQFLKCFRLLLYLQSNRVIASRVILDSALSAGRRAVRRYTYSRAAGS